VEQSTEKSDEKAEKRRELQHKKRVVSVNGQLHSSQSMSRGSWTEKTVDQLQLVGWQTRRWQIWRFEEHTAKWTKGKTSWATYTQTSQFSLDKQHQLCIQTRRSA